jgi:hypothetical protein
LKKVTKTLNEHPKNHEGEMFLSEKNRKEAEKLHKKAVKKQKEAVELEKKATEKRKEAEMFEKEAAEKGESSKKKRIEEEKKTRI